MGVISNLLDLVFPPRCVFCHKFLKSVSKPICEDCKAKLPCTSNGGNRHGEFFSKCVAPLYFEDDVRQSLLRYKFKQATGYAEVYAALLADCIKQNLDGEYDLITWVPLSRERFKERGYDQAMMLALATALMLDDVAVSTLEKYINVEKQSQMGSIEKRRANIAGAYKIEDAELICDKRILLIDDIVTTGTTFSECAKTLLQAGAKGVVCAAVAQTRD